MPYEISPVCSSDSRESRLGEFRPPSEVQVWHIDLALQSDTVRFMESRAPQSVRGRAHRRRDATDRANLIARQLAYRMILARSGAAIGLDDEFLLGVNKKPYLPNGPFFSMSSRRGYAIMAISKAVEIGIDLEVERDGCLTPAARSLFLSDREREKQISADRRDATLRPWVRKEAYLKAIGTGLYRDPNEFDCLDAAGKFMIDDPAAEKKWYVDDISCQPGFIASLCAPTEMILVEHKYFDWPLNIVQSNHVHLELAPDVYR